MPEPDAGPSTHMYIYDGKQDMKAVADNWRAHPWGSHKDQGAALQGERLALCQLPAQAAPHCSDGPDAPALAEQPTFYIAGPR